MITETSEHSVLASVNRLLSQANTHNSAYITNNILESFLALYYFFFLINTNQESGRLQLHSLQYYQHRKHRKLSNAVKLLSKFLFSKAFKLGRLFSLQIRSILIFVSAVNLKYVTSRFVLNFSEYVVYLLVIYNSGNSCMDCMEYTKLSLLHNTCLQEFWHSNFCSSDNFFL